MFFRNDDPTPIGEVEMHSMRRALSKFNTEDEVRFGEDTDILATILNTLTQNRRKFYLVHLPDGAGWVLRRNRPTGVFSGRTIPAEPAGPAASGRIVAEPAGADQPAPAQDFEGRGDAPLALPASAPEPPPVLSGHGPSGGDGQAAGPAPPGPALDED
jgi:hypothetical protein